MKPVIVWFRQDLRLADNPALRAAAQTGAPIIALFILDDGGRALGGASRWWLHHSLAALDASLKKHLVLRRGDAATIIPTLAKQTGAQAVMWNRCYEPVAVARDTQIKSDLTAQGIDVQSFNGALLHEPWELKTQGGNPFRVFTPFWNVMREHNVAAPLSAPRAMTLQRVGGDTLEAWKLLPTKPPMTRCMISCRMSRNTRPAVICRTAMAPHACRRACTGARFRRARSGRPCAPTAMAMARKPS
jgi:deoxyribodipyrimidine photo-lyase